MKTLTTYFTILTIAMFTLSSCSNDDGIDILSNNDAELKSPKKEDISIAEIAITNGFSELVNALSFVDMYHPSDPGLVDLFLNGTDQFTVFAPTNEAFQSLYGVLGVPNFIDLDPEMDGFDETVDLVYKVLLYHVTEGRRAANSVVPKRNYRTIETLLGASFMVKAPENDMIKIMAIGNSAYIVGADFSASNGIVHIIDTVILPI